MQTTTNTLKTAEVLLADQIHNTADAVRLIGQDTITHALAHLKHEVSECKQRLQSARETMVSELSALLADLNAFTSELQEGLTPPQEECPLIGVAVPLTPPDARTEQMEQVQPVIDAMEQLADTLESGAEQDQPRTLTVDYDSMLPLSEMEQPYTSEQDSTPLESPTTHSEAMQPQTDELSTQAACSPLSNEDTTQQGTQPRGKRTTPSKKRKKN